MTPNMFHHGVFLKYLHSFGSVGRVILPKVSEVVSTFPYTASMLCGKADTKRLSVHAGMSGCNLYRSTSKQRFCYHPHRRRQDNARSSWVCLRYRRKRANQDSQSIQIHFSYLPHFTSSGLSWMLPMTSISSANSSHQPFPGCCRFITQKVWSW